MKIKDEEIFFIDYEADSGKCLLYAPLRSYLCLIDTRVKDKILMDQEFTISELLETLKARELIDINNIHNLVSKSSPEISIAITDNCNLQCRYCHASAGDTHKRKSMSLSMVSEILDSYFKTVKSKTVRVSFTGGGEPTFDFEKLKKIIESARENANNFGITCQFRMATNGCYGNDVREYIVNNFSEVSLSFDGPDFIQNYHRPYKNGDESFCDVFETAKYFYTNNFSFALRGTVSDFSLNYLNEVVDFFSTEFPNKRVGLEPLNPYGRAKSDKKLGPPNKADFTEKIIEAYKFSENKTIQLVNAGIGKFDTLRTIFCGAVGIPCWTVSVDGSVSCCTRDNAPELFTFGYFDKVNKRFVFDENKLKKISQMNVFNYKECEDCFCKYHCAGDCPDLRISNLHNCAANRKIGTYILNKKIHQEKEISNV